MRHLHNQASRVALERGELVIGRLASRGLVRPGDLRPSPSISISELARVHSLSYLESLVVPNVLGRIFGIDAGTIAIDATLEAQRRAVGGTLAATRSVTYGPWRLAFNLGGGMHHAHRDQGAGFCAYNDVAVAITELRQQGFTDPIAVVDLDFHQGDGTETIFAEDPSVFTYSLHGSTWQSVDAQASLNVELPPGTGDDAYLEELRKSLAPLLRRIRPRLIFYIAGNDVLTRDALGDFALSPVGVLRRDRYVLKWSEEIRAKVVVTLGGGYGEAAWTSTADLVRFVLTGYANTSPDREPVLERHYREIARSLDPTDLQRERDPFVLTEADIMGDLARETQPRLILGYYTAQGIELALERYGFLDALRERGFGELRLKTDAPDGQRQRLRIFGTKPEYSADELLVLELVVVRRRLEAPPPLDAVETLYVEWLMMQNPTLVFERSRPRLPGQRFPGLGLADETLEMLKRVCVRLELDAIAAKPANYHNAVVAARQFLFLDAEAEGRFRAIRRALQRYPLATATHAVDQGRLHRKDGEQVRWVPALQCLPVSSRARAYFEDDLYQSQSIDAYRRWRAFGLTINGQESSKVGSSVS